MQASGFHSGGEEVVDVASEGDAIPVAVLSERHDLDLIITTWVQGFTARRFVDPDAARSYAADSGVLLIDEAGSDDVLPAVLSRTPALAVVSLTTEATPVTVDVERGVVLASALTVHELRAALDQAVGLRRQTAAVAADQAAPFGAQERIAPRRPRWESLWTAARPPR